MPKRSRMEITFGILNVIALGEEKPTRIMYGTNISWEKLQTKLQSLIEQGFINTELVNKSIRYHITVKGERTLRYYLRAVKDLTTPDLL